MNKIHLALVAFSAFGACVTAHNARASTLCPYAQAGYPDGCAGAPALGAIRQSNFGAYAQQSGQHWVSAHPQPWNVAGWDYAVGYSMAPAKGMYPLVKPDAATAGGEGAGSNLPYTDDANGCVYTAKDNPNMPGSPAVVCRGTLPANGAGVYAGKPVISGIDFSADHAGLCVQLALQIKAAQAIYVVNNNFKKGLGCYVAGQNNLDSLVNVEGGSSNLVLYDNVFDSMAPFLSDQTNAVSFGGTGTVDAEYNAFLNTAGRMLNGDGRSGWLLKYNYIDGMTISPNAAHGEIIGMFPNDAGITSAYEDAEFNTAVWGAKTAGIGGVNAGFMMSNGGGGQTLLLAKMANNTMVSNLRFNGSVSSGKVFVSVQVPYVRNLVMTDNYGDPSGSHLCMEVEGDEINISGYIDNGKGPGGAYSGVAGNIMHVTGRTGKDFILTGAQLYQLSGTLPGNPTITGAAGHTCNGVVMNGSTTSLSRQRSPYGTYCISGPPVAVAVFNGVQTLPQIAAATVTGNVNLLDGSVISRGANLPWNNGVCNGHG